MAAVVTAASLPLAVAVAAPAAAAPTSFTIDGRGWGHGRGMGQYGALGYATGMAGTPWSSAQILDHFYGGTRAGVVAPSSEITVRLVSRDTKDTVVRASEGVMAIRPAGGSPTSMPGPFVRMVVDGSGRIDAYSGSSCTGPWTGRRSFATSELSAFAAGDTYAAFGTTTDVGVTGDWNGDGIDTIGVFRNGVWYLRNSNSSGVHEVSFTYGVPGDIPVVGDWNGDGVDTVGIRRGNVFHLRNVNAGGVADIALGYGVHTDTPVVGDWDGNGTDTLGVRRGNAYYLRNSNTTGPANVTFAYGTSGDRPVVGDWDGNRTDTPGVARPDGARTTFLLRNSNTTGDAQNTISVEATLGQALSGRWTGGPSGVGVREGQTFVLRAPSASTTPLDLCTGSSSTRRYRGEIRAINLQGSQRTVNALGLDDYLRGVVPREVPASWATNGNGTGMAAVEAQAVAARSYAWAENRYAYAKTCDTTACQVYGGMTDEDSRTDAAIRNTAGVVRVSAANGAVARTEFSSSTGGHTVGPPQSPFTSVPDAGDAIGANGRHQWTLELPASAVSSTFCGGQVVSSLSVVARLPDDGYRRAKTVRVGCANGAVDVDAAAFRTRVNEYHGREVLFSTWISVVGDASDPTTGVGVYRASTSAFHLRTTTSGGDADLSVVASAGDVTPVAGDWDGDGVHTVGYRSGQQFHLLASNSTGAATTAITYGVATDVPVVADWDGDGDDDLGVRRGDDVYFRNANGGAPVHSRAELEPTDRVFFGDWDGDGRDDLGWLRGSTFHLDGVGTVPAPAAGTPVTVVLGADGRDSVGVVVSGRTWHVLSRPQPDSGVTTFAYGTSGDRPITGRWRR